MEKLVFGWENLRIETMQRQTEHLEIVLRPTTASADCPLCEQNSQRIHSRYLRSLQDLPCCGQVLRLRIAVRRFFCDNLERVINFCRSDLRFSEQNHRFSDWQLTFWPI